jgi:HPt (histidine-containing phosphotransfer) domain-containing protein
MARNSELPILDPATLEQLQELIDGTDASFLTDLFESYLSTAKDSIDLLRGEVDQEVLRRAAHTLKGSSLNVGASRVADLCKHLENQLRAQPPADMPAQVDQIENRVQQVHDSYAQAITQLTSVTR